jgi:ferredoxin/flavodoxin---NADP+ reductase
VKGDYNATVVGRTEIAPGLMSLRVTPDQPVRFEPGQYVVLGLHRPLAPGGSATDGLIRRSYCIVSEVAQTRWLEFYVTLVHSGELTPLLFDLRVDDRLHVGGEARGVFTLDRARSSHILMVATGTGLAPYMSMIRAELGFGPDGRQTRRALWQCNGPRHFAVIHGARHSWDLGYRAELTALARHCSNFHYLPIVTMPAEDPDWRGRKGTVQDALASDLVQRETGLALTPAHFELFLCGNPRMVDEVSAWAREGGFVPDSGGSGGNLHAERYW